MDDTMFPFDMSGKTFYLGHQGRLRWYIVMHPIVERHGPFIRNEDTSMCERHATELFAFIIHICQSAEMYHNPISSRTHSLRSGRDIELNGPDFYILQRNMMRDWRRYMQSEICDTFWRDHEPCFHVYDYGMNGAIGQSLE